VDKEGGGRTEQLEQVRAAIKAGMNKGTTFVDTNNRLRGTEKYHKKNNVFITYNITIIRIYSFRALGA